MDGPSPRPGARGHTALSTLFAALLTAGLLAPGAAAAQGASNEFTPGNLVVSRSVYLENPSLGLYPFVWNNDLIDASFGITSRIFLDEMTPLGALVGTLEVPNSTQNGVPATKDQLVTSFSSKSELALNLSTDGSVLTFLGYVAPVNSIDVSNTNTPAIFDPTNPVTGSTFRAVALLDQHGKFKFTLTNAYSGNNGRAAILHNGGGANAIFTAGNAGNGANPQPAGVILAAGTQIIQPEQKAMIAQRPDLPTPVGSFNITQLGEKADKIGKDDNFRGLTIFDDVLYLTKGSGGNGVNTVYFVDTSGGACPNGVGLPKPGATLPDSPLAYDPTVLETQGLPSNICILRGFPSTINSKLKKKTTAYPFGIWFADSKTIYLADEGDGDLADAGLTPAGLQKWVFDDASGSWKLVYTMQTGLGLGATYPFPGDSGYPTGSNAATGHPWAPVTDGLRNITGRVNGDGSVTIWGITSTASGSGDPGADPNKLVAITDVLANQSAAAGALESFVTLRTAGFKEVLRGVAFAPASPSQP
jgi:hypothetical protein